MRATTPTWRTCARGNGIVAKLERGFLRRLGESTDCGSSNFVTLRRNWVRSANCNLHLMLTEHFSRLASQIGFVPPTSTFDNDHEHVSGDDVENGSVAACRSPLLVSVEYR
jgi:hypothetical protein